MSKHTPGPWATAMSADHTPIVMAPGEIEGEAAVAHIYMRRTSVGRSPMPEETEANGRLIAAAPELLAALRVMLAYQMNDITAECDQARAAIAKATGEQQ